MPKEFRKPGKVLKLKKSLYGLHQSSRNFFLFLKGHLEEIGFSSQTDIDPCLFVSDDVIILLYVDDTLLFSPKRSSIDRVLKQLRARGLELDEENSVAGFLGVAIERKNNKIVMSQVGLIDKIISALQIDHLPQTKTPTIDTPLPTDIDGDPPNSTYNYASVVGMLGYLCANTRPDLKFAVSQVARFTHSPK